MCLRHVVVDEKALEAGVVVRLHRPVHVDVAGVNEFLVEVVGIRLRHVSEVNVHDAVATDHFVDEVIMRFVDMWAALPFIMVALVVVQVMGQSYAVLVGLLALLSWPGAVRLVRAEVLSLRSRDYVDMARVAGGSAPRIMYKHMLPSVLNVVLVTASLQMGGIILTEATLSFLGVGIPPPTPAWGTLTSDGRNYLNDAWWVSLFPGISIFLVVMSGNFLGDWLRDRLDPTIRQIN